MEIKAINIKQKDYIGGRNDYRKFEDEMGYNRCWSHC